MKTICIYHSIDLDGWMSAAIVKLAKEELYIEVADVITFSGSNKLNSQAPITSTHKSNKLHFFGYNYGDTIPDLSDYDKVIMVDVSFSNEEMLNLANKLGASFIWIDHHQPKINEVSKYLFENKAPTIDGLITIEGRPVKAACELTWEYFFPDKPMPKIVRLLGRYDCFGHKGTKEELKVLQFQYGARSAIGSYKSAYDFLVSSSAHDEDIDNILEMGKSIYQYLYTEAKQAYENGFVISFDYYTEPTLGNEDGYKRLHFITFNKERFNPINFGIDYHKDGYDGAACFHITKDKQVAFSLYNDNEEVDCSVIAKQFGGGGHKGAAGFRLDLHNTDNLSMFLNHIMKIV
jgi:uncharacterized protein